MDERELQTAKFYEKMNNKFHPSVGFLIFLLCYGWIPLVIHYKAYDVIAIEGLIVYLVLFLLTSLKFAYEKYFSSTR